MALLRYSLTRYIAQVNSTLATLDRTKIIELASYFDFWNNAEHAPLP